MTVFSGDVYHTLKETLETIVDDKKGEQSADFKKWCDVKTQSDQYEDDLEMGGPGLASEVNEGAEIPIGTIRQGYITRYLSRKFGLRLIITEETMEDTKYKEAISAAMRLQRALWKTADIDATAMLVRAWDTNYTGGDGLPLCSASHTMPHGGTFSNNMATAVSPSRTAVILARTQVGKYPGHDGVTEGFQLKRVLCPLDQWAVWSGILKTDKVPESDRNEINVVKMDLNLTAVPLKFWNNTTTNYMFQTDCDNGLQFRWRRRPKNRSWVENSQELMQWSISARWSRGWTDPRSVLGVQA